MLNDLQDVALDILDLCLYPRCSPWFNSRAFCNLRNVLQSFGDWKLFSHLNIHSGYGRVHGAFLLPMGRGTLAFLLHDCFCLGTPCFCSLPRPFFPILRLSDFALCGYLRCETCAFACLLCQLLVNAPFCCCKRLLHRRIYLLPPLVLTLSWALFSLILPWDPNGEDQPKKHLLPARRRRLLQSCYYTPPLYVWT
jgi:hypothetical protein